MSYKPLPTGLLGGVRRSAGAYDDDLRQLVQTATDHAAFQILAEFKLPEEKGKAGSARQSLINKYGSTPSVAGFTFKTVKDMDGTVEYLAVRYQPGSIVEGAWEDWTEAREERKLELKAIAQQKRAKARIEAEALAERIRKAREETA